MYLRRFSNHQNLSLLLYNNVLHTRNYSATAVSEYSDEPEYPPILDLSYNERKRREREAWHTKVTELPTVEQKLMELNMPKYYGYKSLILRDYSPKIKGLAFLKYATRTHVTDGLPEFYYDEVRKEAGDVATKIQNQVEDLIQLNHDASVFRKNERNIHITEDFLLGLHRLMNATLSPSVEHIKESIIDINPRIEAFWFLGGIEPSNYLKKKRRNFSHTKDKENEPVDIPIQGTSTPSIGVRGDLGLPEVVPLDHALATTAVPVENLDPRAYGYKSKKRHATITTGFWPGETKEHCRLWLHCREPLEKKMKFIGESYYNDCLMQKAIVASFSQAFAHACYLGFGPVTELTYPIVQQSALTDGQRWNFSTYQMNTCALHSERATQNPATNVLWLDSDQLLYEAVDETGVKGFNPDVLATLVAMYLKKGVERENATPYLAPYKYVAHHPACEEYREEFHKYLLQYILCGRPRPDAEPEIYHWEKIYKIDHKTRHYDPPRRFFEPHYAEYKPANRRLDDYPAVYVPKELRKVKHVRVKPRINSEHLYKYDHKWAMLM